MRKILEGDPEPILKKPFEKSEAKKKGQKSEAKNVSLSSKPEAGQSEENELFGKRGVLKIRDEEYFEPNVEKKKKQ